VTGAPGAQTDDLQNTTDLLRPYVQAEGTSPKTMMLYADVLNYLSHTLPAGEDIAACEEARGILLDHGARDLSNLLAASIYADTTDSQARHTLKAGRVAEAEALEREVYDIAEKVLARRPGDLRSMSNRALAADLLARLAVRRYDHAAALEQAHRHALAGENLVRFNPSDLNSWVFWIRGQEQVANIELEQGRVSQSLASLRATTALSEDSRRPQSLGPLLWTQWVGLVLLEARTGDFSAAGQSLRKAAVAIEESATTEKAGSNRHRLFSIALASVKARVDELQGHDARVFEASGQLATELQALDLGGKETGGAVRDAETFRANLLRNQLAIRTLTALRLGRYGEAEQAARLRAELPPNPNSLFDRQDEISRARVTLAHALVGQGRLEEAGTILDVELGRYRELQAQGGKGLSFQRDYAYALYVDAIAHPAGDPRRAIGLAAARRTLDSLPAEARQLLDIRELTARIAAAG
jgi:tetratricopeptide (TPR) repeat protein